MIIPGRLSTVKRPLAIAIIAWLEIMGGIVALLIFAFASLANPQHIGALVHSRVPFGVQIALSDLGIIVMITTGVGMLKAANWARWTYIAWAGIAVGRALLLFYLTPQQLIIFVVGCVKYFAFIYFLTRPNANSYFRRRLLAYQEDPVR